MGPTVQVGEIQATLTSWCTGPQNLSSGDRGTAPSRPPRTLTGVAAIRALTQTGDDVVLTFIEPLTLAAGLGEGDGQGPLSGQGGRVIHGEGGP